MTATAGIFRDRKQRVLAHVLSRISDSSFEPGARLDVNMVAKEVGVSSTPVREAFSSLENSGILEHLPRFGMVVRKMTLEQVANLYEFREMLEGFAAEKAAERRTDAHLAELRRHCDAMLAILRRMRGREPRLGDDQEQESNWLIADLTFHQVLLEASNNGELVRTANQCHLLSRICRLGRAAKAADRMGWRRMLIVWWHHTRIYRAVQLRQPREAGRWVRWHLVDAKTRRLSAMKNNQVYAPYPAGSAERIFRMENMEI